MGQHAAAKLSLCYNNIISRSRSHQAVFAGLLFFLAVHCLDHHLSLVPVSLAFTTTDTGIFSNSRIHPSTFVADNNRVGGWHTTISTTTRVKKEKVKTETKLSGSQGLETIMPLLLPETASSALAQSTFQDKSILITGASGGLGRALALQFSTCHPKTLVLSARNEATLTEVAQQCQVICPTTKIHTLVCDLSKLEEVKQLGEQACQLVGQDGAPPVIEVLVNNGGLSSRSKFLDTTIEIDELLMRVNYLAGACLAKQCVPGMVQQQQEQEDQQSSSIVGGGKIIWISSVQGLGKLLAKAK
jgi:hypothetical protein